MKLDDLKSVDQDKSLAEDGAWVDIAVPTAGDEGTALMVPFKLRSNDSDKARDWDFKRLKKQSPMYQYGNTPPRSVLDNNDMDKLVEVTVAGWGLEDECSPENVRALLMQKPTVRRDIMLAAAKEKNYRAAIVESLAKNSVTPSTQDSSTGAEAQP